LREITGENSAAGEGAASTPMVVVRPVRFELASKA
jgi:hypothetical protein